MTQASWRAMSIAGLTMGLELLGPLVPGAGARERATQVLTQTGADDDAHGTLRLGTGDRATLDVLVRKLDRKSTFEVVVDGVKVGTITTNGGGNGHVRFSSRPRGRAQRLGFDPRGADVSIRDAQGEDVLHGTLPGGAAGGAQSVCCIADGGGDGPTACENVMPEACVAAGGTVVAVDSCLPDPCATTPPDGGGEVVCCIADSASGAFEDHAVACEEWTPEECAAQQGTVVDAASCAADPCSPTPPQGDVAVCCIPDDDGAECEILSAARCAARGGSASTAAACTVDACPDVPPANTSGDDVDDDSGVDAGDGAPDPGAAAGGSGVVDDGGPSTGGGHGAGRDDGAGHR